MTKTLVIAVTVALVVVAFAPDAWAPPYNSGPRIAVARDCVLVGGTVPVRGSGFRPGTRVDLGSPLGRYTGPNLAPIADMSVRANASGAISAELPAARSQSNASWFYQPRVVSADGTPAVGRGSRQSFAGFALGTRRACLDRTHPSARPRRQ